MRVSVAQDEYKDTNTLKRRLQQLAMAMGLRAQQARKSGAEGEPMNGTKRANCILHGDADNGRWQRSLYLDTRAQVLLKRSARTALRPRLQARWLVRCARVRRR